VLPTHDPGVTLRGFFILNENQKISVHNQNTPKEILAFWSHDRITNAFIPKLRNLAVIKGERKNNWVRFDNAHFFREPQVSKLMSAIESGVIFIDFDARESRPGSRTLRDYGTKFRIRFDGLKLIYHEYEVIGEAPIPLTERPSTKPKA